MATYCDNCGGAPEFHVGGQCWCEDYCDCKGYAEGGNTIPTDSRAYMIARCRHCQTPMGESYSWFTENYCRTCEFYMGDITTMMPGETVTIDFSGQPFGGFCESNSCRMCESYYSEEPSYHICYTDGGCIFCAQGTPRRLPDPAYMNGWKCNGCTHSRTAHAQDGFCLECRRLHRRRCWSYIMRQPTPATKRAQATAKKRREAARKMVIIAIRAPQPEREENVIR